MQGEGRIVFSFDAKVGDASRNPGLACDKIGKGWEAEGHDHDLMAWWWGIGGLRD